METINDIIREMRAWADLERHRMERKHVALFADRIDAAYKRDLQAMVDAGEIDMKTAMCEVERLREENERLKAAIKPIIDFRPEIVGNHGEEEAWDSDLMMEAMVEARDIYNGGAK